MQIKLKSLHLINFMTYHDNTFTFADTTKISGKNGSGKSSIVNGYMWLMFDTDMELHSNPKIRREIDGQPVNDMDTAVEAVFDIDGKEVTARKVQKRTITEKEELVDGVVVKKTIVNDDNSYFINEVPKTLKAFNERFGVGIKLLQMCSNINAFLSKKDKEMREYLFTKVENIKDIDITEKYEGLSELIPLLEQYTTEEIESMNKASKTKIVKEIPILDGQIKEKERDVTENSHIALPELELSRNVLNEKIADIKAKQADISKQYEEYQKLSDGVMELKFELNGLQQKANEELEKQRRELRGRENDLLQSGGRNQSDIGYKKTQIHNCELHIADLTKDLEKAREEYTAKSNMEFDENDLICKMCGQPYPQEKAVEIRMDFHNRKNDILHEVAKRGNSTKEELQREKDILQKSKEELETLEKSLENIKEELEKVREEIKKLPQSIDISGTEEYKTLQSQIAEKEVSMQKGNSADEIRQSLSVELSEAQEQLLEVEKQIAKSDTSADEERLAELKKQRIDLEQSKADCEKILDLLSELDKKKNESLSESINSLFGIVDWKLYEYNKSGGYKSVCVPMLDGKSILDITSNKGNRILGRLDIINSIQKIEEINCPIFLDDAESLDTGNIAKAVDMLECQAILLQVNNEDELKIEEVR